MLLALLAVAVAAPDGVFPLDGVDAGTPDTALAPFVQVVGEADLVGLGESRHCGGGYLAAKARLVRWLVETQGFRLVLIESPWAWGRTATRYVSTGEGDAKSAMGSFYVAFHDTSTLEMLEWLAAWNIAHPDDPVRFHGFDVQDELPRLLDVLKAAGVSAEDIARCEAGPCEVASDHPWVRLAVSTIAVRHALTAERDRSPIAYSEIRDLGMADTLLAIREIVAPEARTVVLAHNMHLAERGSVIRWADTGEHLARRLGDDYVSIGLVARDLSTSCQGAPREDGPRDIERAIGARAGSPAALVDLDVAMELAGRWSVGGLPVVAGEQYDALLWFDVVGAAKHDLWRDSPLETADAVGAHRQDLSALYRTPDEAAEQQRLWAAYAGWLESQRGCVADGRRRRAGGAEWQRFECRDGNVELRIRRSARDAAWRVSVITRK